MSSVKPFSAEFTKSILAAIDIYTGSHPGPHYAAFDVDGTLWDSDVGENFFQYQIDHAQIPALKGMDPWAHYLSLKKKHPPEAYLWLAQICSGYDLKEVEAWAQKAVEKFPLNIFESQKNLIKELRDRHIQVYAVSASVKWAVAAALPLVGLRKENAVGVATHVIDGKVTKDQDGFITWREGKAEALLQHTHHVKPLFCSGNSSGDIHLLQLAQVKALAVQTQNAQSQHKSLFEDESHLRQLALKNQWLTHSFI